MTGRLWIGDVAPRPAGGAYPAKAIVGEARKEFGETVEETAD